MLRTLSMMAVFQGNLNGDLKKGKDLNYQNSNKVRQRRQIHHVQMWTMYKLRGLTLFCISLLAHLTWLIFSTAALMTSSKRLPLQPYAGQSQSKHIDFNGFRLELFNLGLCCLFLWGRINSIEKYSTGKIFCPPSLSNILRNLELFSG